MATTVELNQRIVYAGLLRMSEDRNVIKAAFTHWNQRHSNVPFDVFDIVEDLVIYLDLGVNEKKGLMIGMHNASAQLYDDLKPVPAFILGEQLSFGGSEATDDPENTPNTIPAHHEVTARYLQLISLQIKRNNAAIHKELTQAVIDEGLGAVNDAVLGWASDGLNQISFAPSVEVQHCQDLAHEFYVLVCDFLGPVESDIIVNRAIDELSKLEASRHFDPRKLL